MATAGGAHRLPKKHPERNELLSHLQLTGNPPAASQAGQKRPFSCSFGDHDYCQVLRPGGALQRKVLRSWEPSGLSQENWTQQAAPCAQTPSTGRKEDSVLLRDQEIRARLTKHFGLLESALEDEDSSSSSGESSFLLEEDGEEDNEEEDSGVSPPCSDHCPYQSPPSKAARAPCSRSRSSSGSSCRSRSPASRRTFR